MSRESTIGTFVNGNYHPSAAWLGRGRLSARAHALTAIDIEQMDGVLYFESIDPPVFIGP